MNTLASCVSRVVQEGYTDSFKVTSLGLFSCTQNRYYRPDQVHVINCYRFEGQGGPGDSAIMYVLETNDGLKGTAIDADGAYPDGSVHRFMAEVESIRKSRATLDQN